MAITPAKPMRASLTTEELRNLPFDELLRLKLTEEEKNLLRAINQEKVLQREEMYKRLRAQEEPILADLRANGLEVSSVWDLVNTSKPYPEAIPILLEHLVLKYPDRITEGIARALAVPDARGAWSLLVTEYCRAPQGWENGIRLGAKSGLAAALSATATDEVIEELASLAKDVSNGGSRLLLLRALRQSKTTIAKKTIEELSDDPALRKEITSWRKRK